MCQIIHYIYYLIINYVQLHDVCFLVVTTVATLNSGIVLHQFSLVTWLLKLRFQWINEDFIEFYNKYKKDHLFKYTLLKSLNKPYIACCFRTKEKSATHYIDALSTIHNKIRNIATTLQKNYAPMNLIIILKAAVSLTTTVHLMLDGHFIHSHEDKKLIDQVKEVSSAFTNVVYIALLTLTCTWTAREANRLATLQLQLPLKSRLVAMRVSIQTNYPQIKLNFRCGISCSTPNTTSLISRVLTCSRSTRLYFAR